VKAKSRYRILSALFVGVFLLMPFRPLRVEGASMDPTLRHGETFVLDLAYWRLVGGLRRDDVVVVRHRDEKWVKRLIGLPGDEIQVVYLPNGLIAEVDNVSVNPSLRREGRLVRRRQVGPGEIFVIGDNLNFSQDSTNEKEFELEHVIGVVRQFTLSRRFPFPRP
jgi:signal peptidase I